MKTILTTLTILITIILGVFIYVKNGDDGATNEKCCTECTKEGEVKYYSIDTKYDKCGENCLNPKLYPIFKLFEKGLTLANGVTCESLGYTKYEVTESHGVYPIKTTLDKYSKP